MYAVGLVPRYHFLHSGHLLSARPDVSLALRKFRPSENATVLRVVACLPHGRLIGTFLHLYHATRPTETDIYPFMRKVGVSILSGGDSQSEVFLRCAAIYLRNQRPYVTLRKYFPITFSLKLSVVAW